MEQSTRSNQFSLPDALSFGFSALFKNFFPILGLLAALVGGFFLIWVLGILGGVVGVFTTLLMPIHLVWYAIAMSLLLLLSGIVLSIAYIKGMLQIHDYHKVTWNQLLTGINWFNALFGLLIFILGMGIGFILLVIPGYIFVTRYYFFPYLLLENYGSIGDCFGQAARLSKGIRWKLFFLTIMQSFLGSLIILLPALTLTNMHMYRELQGKAQK